MSPEKQATIEEAAAPIPRLRVTVSDNPLKPPNPRAKPYKNGPEEMCALTLRQDGFNPNKRGYPDFWFLDHTSRLSLVEVKPDGLRPTGNQWAFMAAAARAGLRVMTFRPSEGLRDVTKMLGGADGAPIPTADFSDKALYLQKGANCQVCVQYIAPGTALVGLVWCAQHRAWRHSGCQVSPVSLNVRAHARAEREREERGGMRPCTCTSTTATRARAFNVQLDVQAKIGTRVTFEVKLGDSSGRDGGQVSWWVSGKAVNLPEAIEIIATLGFEYVP